MELCCKANDVQDEKRISVMDANMVAALPVMVIGYYVTETSYSSQNHSSPDEIFN